MANEVNSNQELDLTEELYINGINGTTGEYLTPPISWEKLAGIVSGENPEEDVENYDSLEEKLGQEEATFGLIFGLDSRLNLW